MRPRLSTSHENGLLEALYVYALNTEMRKGEILALKWDDVDLETGTLRLSRTLTKAGKAYSTVEPKTEGSRRVIRLTAAAGEALRAYLSRQLEEMERMGSLYQPLGPRPCHGDGHCHQPLKSPYPLAQTAPEA